jgi:protoheme IX farnesyltransferase
MMHNRISMKLLLKLTRVYMSVAIAFSALAGYIFCNHGVDWQGFIVFSGVLLLAGGASALNQYQERNQDVLMSRTKDRPLPMGQLSPASVLTITAILIVSGTLLLFFLTTPLTALLGIFNIAWYNAVYTPLKKKTSFAVLIGAITGAIPPMMGWTAAGGSLFSREIMFIAFFMFFWQIPHFCLLLLKFKKDYEAAGFPSLTSFLDEKHVQFIVFVWIVGTSLSTLGFPAFQIISGWFLTSSIVVLNVVLLVFFYRNTFSSRISFSLTKAFRSLYLYQILVLAILIVQALK